MTQKSKELDAEIQEMEAALFQGQENKETSEEPEATQLEEKVDETDEMELVEAGDADIISTTEDVEKPKPKRVSWKKRFTGLNHQHAAFKHQTAQQLSEMQALLDRANQEITDLKGQLAEVQTNKDAFTEAFSAEDIEVLGEETVTSLKKATQNVVEPLQKQLEQEKNWREEQTARSIQANKAQEQQAFLNRLGSVVPDYLAVDSDPRFIRWMKGIDPYSGYTREMLFKQAERNGDVGRVANFMNEFKNVLNPLESKITPSTASRPRSVLQQTQAVKPMSWEEINKHYEDVSKGKFKGKEKERQEIEARIDAQAFE